MLTRVRRQEDRGAVVVRVRCAGSRDGAARCCSRLVVASVAETLQGCEGRRCVVVADEMKRCGGGCHGG